MRCGAGEATQGGSSDPLPSWRSQRTLVDAITDTGTADRPAAIRYDRYPIQPPSRGHAPVAAAAKSAAFNQSNQAPELDKNLVERQSFT
jgi:hypothetical protein